MQINNKKENIKTNYTLDIRGRVCPMTFVYTKLKLEELKRNDVLEVHLDFKPAIKNIPKNCKRQKLAELLSVKLKNSQSTEWILKLKKI